MSGTGAHWLSTADFRGANGAALVISGNRKTRNGSLRNHTQLVDVVIKSQTDIYRELKICGDQWRGKKKKKRKISITEKRRAKEANRAVNDEEAKLS